MRWRPVADPEAVAGRQGEDVDAAEVRESDGSAGAIGGTGFAGVDRIYIAGRRGYLRALGGSCGNVLVSLAMLGHPVVPVASLGTDPDGDLVVSAFRAAGARTDCLFRRPNRRSPVMVEHLDPATATHRFSVTAPEDGENLPRYWAMDDRELAAAGPALRGLRIFYVDRLSRTAVAAMEQAAAAGALVCFEPSVIGHPDLFRRALAVAHVVKYAEDRLGRKLAGPGWEWRGVTVRTQGADGLAVGPAGRERRLPAIAAPRVVDTCGAGDMVTVGILDRLGRGGGEEELEAAVLAGAAAGQALAAANCAFVGARGVFQALGAGFAGRVLARGLTAEDRTRILALPVDAGW